MKHRLPAGTKEFFCERQQIWRPCADRHYNTIAHNALAILEYDSFHPTIAFI
jgi:hypothetical protein